MKLAPKIVWSVPEAATTVLCTPDDGRDGCPKHVDYFDVLLTVHLSVILVINQLDAQNLVLYKFNKPLYMFRALSVHHQEVKIVLYRIWYTHTCRWPSGAQVERRFLSTCGLEGHLQSVMIPDTVYTILTSLWWAHSARNM